MDAENAMDAALLQTFLPSDLELRITGFRLVNDECIIDLASTVAESACPDCGFVSDRVHGRYVRRLQDLPCGSTPLRYALTARKFACVNTACSRGVFCERLIGLASPHARCTDSLTASQRTIGFALGGEAGSRLSSRLGMPSSADTLLRRVRTGTDSDAEKSPAPPRFVGIDDWAFRKGQRYGTILIDLERRRIIDIFPERDGAALRAWLKANPQVEVITRDRWAAYAEACTEAAPQAKQVADRWHLLKNLREAVERILARFTSDIRPTAEASKAEASQKEASQKEASQKEASKKETTQVAPSVAGSADIASDSAVKLRPEAPHETAAEQKRPASEQRPISAREQARAAKRVERAERHRRIRELSEQGRSTREIAKEIGCSRKTVIRYLHEAKCPDWNPGRRAKSRLDEHRDFIEAWVAQGGRNAADLHRDLKEKGCPASYDAVRRFLARRIGSTGKPGPRPHGAALVAPPVATKMPTARRLSFAVLNPNLDANYAPDLLKRTRDRTPALDSALKWAEELAERRRRWKIGCVR